MKVCFVSPSHYPQTIFLRITLQPSLKLLIRQVPKGCFKWTNLTVEKVGLPQGSILGTLLLLIYIIDLLYKLKSNVKLFVDDISLFIIIKDNESSNILNNNLLLISKWAYNWKMLFIPDPSKRAQEVKFLRKRKVQIHPPIIQNNIELQECLSKAL